MSPSPSLWPLWVAAVVTVAAVGFVSGTRAPELAARPEVAGQRGGEAVPAYRDLASARRGPNGGQYAGALAGLRATLPGVNDPVGAGDRAAALAARAQRRAYDGAPPVIPHTIDQRGLPACLACHEQGAVVGGKVARVMSHEPRASCVQCHVVAHDPRPLELRSPRPDNGFVGLASSAGRRAWPGAPPVMPHPAFMREACASCHGVAGEPGLRTTHPARQSCGQCHAPDARLDQAFPAVTR